MTNLYRLSPVLWEGTGNGYGTSQTVYAIDRVPPLLRHLSPVLPVILVIRQLTGIIDSSIASNHWILIMLEVESVGLIYQHGCPLLHRMGIQ